MFELHKNHVHIWSLNLEKLKPHLSTLQLLLSGDELERANRFKFAIHRERFTLTRGILRSVLSLYTQLPAQKIIFSYSTRKKPFIPNEDIQFNVSHSHTMALIALTKTMDVGVDIEKIKPIFKDAVAKRFFSEEEYKALHRLSGDEQVTAFYCIWAKKEALIKALGEGLYAPLDTFSVSPHEKKEIISLMHENKRVQYEVQTLSVSKEFQAAVATSNCIDTLHYWQWNENGPTAIK